MKMALLPCVCRTFRGCRAARNYRCHRFSITGKASAEADGSWEWGLFIPVTPYVEVSEDVIACAQVVWPSVSADIAFEAFGI